MNSVTIYGSVVGDPLYTSGSRARTLDLTVAVQRPSKRQGGSGADFVPVRLWNTLADDLKGRLAQGDHVLAQGRLRIEKNGTALVSAHDAWIVRKEHG
jgi:single-stranded DNA-binding protein